jgi:hypothetical protein
MQLRPQIVTGGDQRAEQLPLLWPRGKVLHIELRYVLWLVLVLVRVECVFVRLLLLLCVVLVVWLLLVWVWRPVVGSGCVPGPERAVSGFTAHVLVSRRPVVRRHMLLLCR